MSKKFILVAAPPASGKTYVSELLAKSIENSVYLDKDDLADLLRAAFRVSGNEVDMDGGFYIDNLRDAEYSTILNIAFSALRFSQTVILNAPFGKEVRSSDYMKSLKERANALGARLILVWVKASPATCYERMKKRNSPRDRLKLENFEQFVSKINFTPPTPLESEGAVDRLIVFDAENRMAEGSLKETLELLDAIFPENRPFRQ